MATATLKKSKPAPPRKHRKSQHPSTTTSITRWFRAASQVGKIILPQRAGCPPGQPFPFVHPSPLYPLSFVYRLSATALSRGLGGQTLRNRCASGRYLSAIRADRSASRLPLFFGLFERLPLLRESET